MLKFIFYEYIKYNKDLLFTLMIEATSDSGRETNILHIKSVQNILLTDYRYL